MLAPLKEHSLQECATGAPALDQAIQSKAQFHSAAKKIQDLRRGLKESRTRLGRTIEAAHAQYSRLSQELCRGRLGQMAIART